ncbi:uncharacterized protein LOC122319883 [Drosophila ficusphila]|uniref:uncharacterized protein LOC122319883 n=1 Tax=Drosophila ficusphila TaxID=30025 RepID=UPI001C8A15E8|nr:uncharacterized protein LOC122319883 [Drosophila ficusphila]
MNEMWRARRFCYCTSLQIGCTIIAFFTLCLCAAHLVEFFRMRYITDDDDDAFSDWANLLWGALHLVAAMCLSYSVLVQRGCTPILVYIVTETLYLIYVIIYASVSCAQGINIYANHSLPYCISYWVFVFLTCVITIYFLYIITSYYFLRREQRKTENTQV